MLSYSCDLLWASYFQNNYAAFEAVVVTYTIPQEDKMKHCSKIQVLFTLQAEPSREAPTSHPPKIALYLVCV